ncbi:MAG: accessory gene regulator B family protein [Eubacteriales bacterium]
MLEKQSEKIVNILIKNKRIEQEQKEIIKYGIHALLTVIVNTMLLVCIGMILNMFVEAIVLLIGFSCLRSYSGGYHCKTEIRCLIVSNSIFIIILAVCMLTPNDMKDIVGIMSMCVGAILLLRFAPVDTENKQLDDAEYSVYKKRARVLLAMELGAILILKYLQFSELAYVLSLAIIVIGIMVWIQKCKNCRK